jgi:glucose-1-phosphate cytidylyltransferase
MKVVLFCGGEGLRLREHGDALPKPMTRIGYRPILWHVMRYYAHYGHRDFVLCLGYRADAIKDYFLHYDEAISNDFVLTDGNHVEHLRTDITDWRITFADTGARTLVGGRMRAVRRYVEGEEMFLANYGDIVTDAPLDEVIDAFRSSGKVAALLATRPQYSFHVVRHEGDGEIAGIVDARDAGLWINGGYYVFRREIFDYIRGDEDLVDAPFARLIAEDQLMAFRYDGFWISMDTLKDLARLEALEETGAAPWEPWRGAEPVAANGADRPAS